MENSQPLATESFSYSWLIDTKPPSSDSLIKSFRSFPDFCDETGTFELQQRVLSRRFLDSEAQNFNFDVPESTSAVSLVDADEIFADGHIIPVYINKPSLLKAFSNSNSVPPTPLPSFPSKDMIPSNRSHHYFLRKLSRSSNKLLDKCFRLLGPFWGTFRWSRKNIRVDDLDRKVCEVQSWNNSLQTPPRLSTTYSSVDWPDFKQICKKVDSVYGLKKAKSWNSSPKHASPKLSPCHSSTTIWCDVEGSINEAILYCKRSIEK